jgi:hypothetical protein
MLLLLAVVLAVAWIVAFGAYHVSTVAIHLLLVLAAVALVAHFVTGVSRRRMV